MIAPVGATGREGGGAKRRVFRNTAVLIALRVVVPALSLPLVFLLSRWLGSEALGRYTLAYTWLYFFTTIAPLGLYAVIAREGAREPSRLGRVLSNATTLASVSSLLLSIALYAFAFGFGYDAETATAIAILGLGLLPWTIGSLLEGGFVALERMDYMAYAAGIESVLKVGLGIAAILAGLGVDAVLLAAVAGRVVACGVSVALLRSAGVKVGAAFDPSILRSLTRVAPTFLLMGVFATLYWRIDVFMLSKMRQVEEVGFYGAAWRLLELAMVAPQSLCLSLYPQVVAAFPSDQAKVERLGVLASRYLAALSLPAAVLVTILAGPLVALFYGPGFDESASSLVVLMWTLVPYGIVRYHAYLLVAAERQRVDLWLNASMTGVNVLMNLVLIPTHGAAGAAFATFLSVLVYAASQYAYLARRLPGTAAPATLPLPPVIACLAAGTLAWVLRDAPVVLALGAAGAVYVVLLVALGFVGRDELDSLQLGWLAPIVRRRGRES